ncbi:hypothetical protein DL93DRAFT_2077833 [Clavulina sp. PMI_390]|nr:hypothetical protein DL93DRAFT_2077833 [Clavulina sp. PMI_390]
MANSPVRSTIAGNNLHAKRLSATVLSPSSSTEYEAKWFAFVFECMIGGEWELYENEYRATQDKNSRDAFYLKPSPSHQVRKRCEMKQSIGKA